MRITFFDQQFKINTVANIITNQMKQIITEIHKTVKISNNYL